MRKRRTQSRTTGSLIRIRVFIPCVLALFNWEGGKVFSFPDPPETPIGKPDVLLPPTYEAYRVMGRVTLGVNRIRDDPGPADDGHLFNSIHSEIAGIGSAIKLLQRHCKTAGEGPWWPSYFTDQMGTLTNLQHSAPGPPHYFEMGEDLVLDMDAEAAIVGQQIFYYYRHMEEAYFAGVWNDNGDNKLEAGEWDPLSAHALTWIARKKFDPAVGTYSLDDIQGMGWPQTTNRGIWLCVNSPYRAVVKDRVVDLAAKGGVGNHFDFKHNPPDGCFCYNCRHKWVSDGWGTGSQFDQLEAGDPQLLDFYSASVKEYFDEIADAARTVNPTFICGVKAAEFASINIRGLRSANAVRADILMLEYGQGTNHPIFADHLSLYEPGWTTKWALAWTLTRDGIYGRPPKIAVDATDSESTEEEIFALAGAVVTFGCVAANAYHGDGDVNNPQLVAPERFASTHDMGEALSSYIRDTRPVCWLGILFPESALVARGWNRDSSGDEALLIYREVYSPIFAAVELLNEKGAPYGLIMEEQVLEYGDAYYDYLDAFDHIICPVVQIELSTELVAALTTFVQRGGTVMYLDGRFPAGSGDGDRWDGYPPAAGGMDRDQLKSQFWSDIGDRPEIYVDKENGTDGVDVESSQLRRRTAMTDDTLLMMSRRWDWATTSLSGSVPPLPAGPATGYVIKIEEGVNPQKAYLLDLTGHFWRQSLPIIQSEIGDYEIVVPAFRQVCAILIDRIGDTP